MKPVDSCTCSKCVHDCERTPGWFLPGEAEKTAEMMGLSFEEFRAKYLIKDSCSNRLVDDAPFVWSPRKATDPVEEESRSRSTQWKFGPCIFLKDKHCMIHEEKPYECAVTMCKPTHSSLRDSIESRWVEAGAPLGMRPFEGSWESHGF